MRLSCVERAQARGWLTSAAAKVKLRRYWCDREARTSSILTTNPFLFIFHNQGRCTSVARVGAMRERVARRRQARALVAQAVEVNDGLRLPNGRQSADGRSPAARHDSLEQSSRKSGRSARTASSMSWFPNLAGHPMEGQHSPSTEIEGCVCRRTRKLAEQRGFPIRTRNPLKRHEHHFRICHKSRALLIRWHGNVCRPLGAHRAFLEWSTEATRWVGATRVGRGT